METLQPYLLGWLVPTVLAAIAGYARGKVSQVRDERKRFDEDRRTLDAIAIMVCRLAIYDEHFSTDEKVDAYRIYRAKGGNNRTKRYMDELLGEDADAYLERHK